MSQESINSIEIQGRIGNVNKQSLPGGNIYKFSVCTEHCYKSKDGTPVIDCTWHSVVCTGDKIKGGEPQKYDFVNVKGRLRMFCYIGADQIERKVPEISADTVTILPKD